MVDEKEKKAIVNYQVKKDSEFIFMTPVMPTDDRGIRDFMVSLAEPLGLEYQLGHCYLTNKGKLAITKSGYRKIADDLVLTFKTVPVMDDIENQRFIFKATATNPKGRSAEADGCADGREKKFIGKSQYDAWQARGWKEPPTVDPSQWWKVRNNAETRAKNRAIEEMMKVTVVNADEMGTEEEKAEYKKNAIPVEAEDPFDNTPLKVHETKRSEVGQKQEFVLDLDLPTAPIKTESIKKEESGKVESKPIEKIIENTKITVDPKNGILISPPLQGLSLSDLDLGDLGNFGTSQIKPPVETASVKSEMVIEKIESKKLLPADPMHNLSDEDLANEEEIANMDEKLADVALVASTKYDPCSTTIIEKIKPTESYKTHTDLPFCIIMEVLESTINQYMTYAKFIKGTTEKGKEWFGYNSFIENASKGVTLYDFTMEVVDNFIQVMNGNDLSDKSPNLTKIHSQIKIKMGELYIKLVGLAKQEHGIEQLLKKSGLDIRYLNWLTNFLTKNKIGVQ